MGRLGTIGIGVVMSAMALGTARAGVLEHQVLKGKAADATFLSSTPETCADGSAGSADTFVDIFGEESLLSSRLSGRTLINAVSVIVVVTDSCAGTASFAAGALEGGFHAITPRRATLDATVPLTDLSTGAPAGTMVVALALQGGSIVAFTTETDRIVFPDSSFRTDQVKSTTRPASLTGSVSLNGVELIGHRTQAQMFDNRDSVIDLGR